MINLAPIASALIVAVLAAWYLAANRNWIRLVRKREPELAVDPVTQPVQWATGAPSRLRRLLLSLRTPSSDDELEAARVRTLRRAVTACLVGALAVLGLPVATSVVAKFLKVETDRGGVTGVWIFVVFIGILAYWIWRLGRAMYRYGNGGHITAVEVALSIFGLASAVLVAAFISGTPVGVG